MISSVTVKSNACCAGGDIVTLLVKALRPLVLSKAINSYAPICVTFGTSTSTPVVPCEANCNAVGVAFSAVA